MKTVSIILLSLFLTSFVSNTNQTNTKQPKETTVIICTGKYAKCYHNSQCRGMNACKGEQKKVSLSDAKNAGLTPCGYCYK